jgi:membrane protease YdiL (CAAX protease family)
MPRSRSASRASYFAQSREPLTALVAVLPLFVAYQLGILLTGGVRNGVDFVSGILFAVFGDNLSGYLAFNAAILGAFLVAVAVLRKNGELHPRLFPFMLLESALYAVLVGGVVNLLMDVTGVSALLMVPGHALANAPAGGDPGLIYKLVMSVGAGLYEELAFRLILLGGLFAVLQRGGVGRVGAGVVAVVVSSLIFSGVHHLGSMGEAFTLGAFAFRFFAGVVFAALYQTRGFAIAAWTHALYDIWVMVFLGVK